ncbi:MAG TPA: hypothetical protein VFK40_08130 [Nitrososphaeraceae archaeon]|nr:hypothetical protein [Nitrososphaeraceae archaeon]
MVQLLKQVVNIKDIMVECVRSHIRTQSESNITKFYYRLTKKNGNPKATVAASSKLLKKVY